MKLSTRITAIVFAIAFITALLVIVARASAQNWSIPFFAEHVVDEDDAYSWRDPWYSMIQSIAFSPDGKTVAAGGGDGNLSGRLRHGLAALYDAQDGKFIHELKGHLRRVNAVAFSPDGKTLATVTIGPDRTIRLFDVATGELKHQFEAEPDVIRGYDLTSVTYSPDGKILAVAAQFGREPGFFHLYDASTYELLFEQRFSILEIGKYGAVYSIRFSPDSQTLAITVEDREQDNHFLQLWDVKSRTLNWEVEVDWAYSETAVFSPDGQMVAALGYNERWHRIHLTLRDIKTGEQIRVLPSGRLYGRLEFHPNGKFLVGVSAQKFNSRLRIWNVSTGTLMKEIDTDSLGINEKVRGIKSLAFSPDGKRLLVGLPADEIDFWGGYKKFSYLEMWDFAQILDPTFVGIPESASPSTVTLNQNYPNPFNPTTTISFDLPQPDHVRLRVFDVLGRHVETLVGQYKQPGEHRVRFAPASLTSGTYFYELRVGTTVLTRSMQLMK